MNLSKSSVKEESDNSKLKVDEISFDDEDCFS